MEDQPMSDKTTTKADTETEHVARRLDLYWRSTCGFQPEVSHELTWPTFVEQAKVAIAAAKEIADG